LASLQGATTTNIQWNMGRRSDAAGLPKTQADGKSDPSDRA
jgi:hypothetical protein